MDSQRSLSQVVRSVLWEGLMGTRLTSVLCLYASTAAILLAVLGLVTQVGRFALPPGAQLLIVGLAVGAQFLWAKGAVPAESEAVDSKRTLRLRAPRREIENLAAQVAELKNKASQLASALRRLDEYVPSLARLGELNHEIQELTSTTREALQFSLAQAAPLIRPHRESGFDSYLVRTESLASPQILDDLAVKIDRLSVVFERQSEGLSPEAANEMLAELSRIREEIRDLSRITEKGNEQVFYLLRDYLQDSRQSRRDTQDQIAEGLMSLREAITRATERIAERLSVIAESVAPAKTESPTGEVVKEEPEVSGE